MDLIRRWRHEIDIIVPMSQISPPSTFRQTQPPQRTLGCGSSTSTLRKWLPAFRPLHTQRPFLGPPNIHESGSQRQVTQCGQQLAKTVEGTIEESIKKLYPNSPFQMGGSSRTDAGVSAIVNTCGITFVPSPEGSPPQGYKSHPTQLLKHVNKTLIRNKEDIRISKVLRVPEHFDVQKQVAKRTYVYRIGVVRKGDERKPMPVVHEQRLARVNHPFDIDKFLSAAEVLTGTHDFRNFTSSRFWEKYFHSEKGTVRCVNIHIKRGSSIMENNIGPMFAKHDVWEIEVESTGFMFNMIRRMAGAMISVAKGKMSMDLLQQIINEPESIKPDTNPVRTSEADGLFLKDVQYPAQVMEEMEEFQHNFNFEKDIKKLQELSAQLLALETLGMKDNKVELEQNLKEIETDIDDTYNLYKMNDKKEKEMVLKCTEKKYEHGKDSVESLAKRYRGLTKRVLRTLQHKQGKEDASDHAQSKVLKTLHHKLVTETASDHQKSELVSERSKEICVNSQDHSLPEDEKSFS